jgi:hypothetical protein
MATKTETIEHRLCDLCGHETTRDEMVTLHRSDNKIAAAKLAATSAMRSQPGQAHVDVCPNCQGRPVGEVVMLMYPNGPSGA